MHGQHRELQREVKGGGHTPIKSLNDPNSHCFLERSILSATVFEPNDRGGTVRNGSRPTAGTGFPPHSCGGPTAVVPG